MTDVFQLHYPKQPLQARYQTRLVVTAYNRPNYLKKRLCCEGIPGEISEAPMGADCQGGTMNHIYRLETPTHRVDRAYTIGLVVTTYNRPIYLKRFLRSLRQSKLEDVIVLLIDDGSTDPETEALLDRFYMEDVPILKAYRLQKNGCTMYENLQYGWDLLGTQYQCQYLTNIDPDTIMQQNWLQTLWTLYEQKAQANASMVVTGFNAYQHPVLDYGRNYYRKQSLGGLNLFFDVALYKKLVRPALVDIDWDWQIVHALQEHDYPIFCTRPSVIQHIGREGIWSGKSSVFDFAIDYGSANPLYTMLSCLYFRSRRRAEWYLQQWGQRLRLKRSKT